MPLQNFVAKALPAISAAWLNAVDALKVTIFADATTKAQARAALTLDAPMSIGQGGTGAASAATARTSLGSTAVGDSVFIAASALAARQALAIPSLGVVRMVLASPGMWIIYKPDGTVLSQVGTTTDGLQEAINYACTNGHSLWVTGGSAVDVADSTAAVINCTTGIVWPPMQGKYIHFDWCTVNFTTAVVSDGMTFNSCMMVTLDFNGQIAYSGNASCVKFVPTTDVPLDLATAIVDSKFYFTTLACNGGTNPRGMHFDSGSGPILGNHFEVHECNGANIGQHGILVSAALDGFLANTVVCHHLHMFTGVSLRIGDSAADAPNLHSNIFNMKVLPNDAASIGIQMFGTDNLVICALLNNEGTINTGIKLESSAARNQFIVSRNNGATKVTDSSTTKDNVGIYGQDGPKDLIGVGTPEAAIIAPIGSTYRRSDGGAATSFYVKESGTGNTGWVGK